MRRLFQTGAVIALVAATIMPPLASGYSRALAAPSDGLIAKKTTHLKNEEVRRGIRNLSVGHEPV